MRDYKKLEVWAKAHQLYLYVKKDITVKFPKEERDKEYNIVNKMINESRAMLIIFLKFLRR